MHFIDTMIIRFYMEGNRYWNMRESADKSQTKKYLVFFITSIPFGNNRLLVKEQKEKKQSYIVLCYG